MKTDTPFRNVYPLGGAFTRNVPISPFPNCTSDPSIRIKRSICRLDTPTCSPRPCTTLPGASGFKATGVANPLKPPPHFFPKASGKSDLVPCVFNSLVDPLSRPHVIDRSVGIGHSPGATGESLTPAVLFHVTPVTSLSQSERDFRLHDPTKVSFSFFPKSL